MLRRNHDGLAPISLASRRVTGARVSTVEIGVGVMLAAQGAAVTPNTFSNLVPVLWLA